MSAGHEQFGPTSDEADKGRSTTHRGRKKADGGGIRTWFHLTDTGDVGLLDIGRYAMRHRTGISARDYRILDPLLAYPPSIHGRKEAVVINLEHIKAIVMAKDVWLLNHTDPAIAPFIEKLKQQTTNYNCEDIMPSNPTSAETNPDELPGLSRELKSASSSRRRVAPFLDPQLEIVEKKEDQRAEAISHENQTTVPSFEFIVIEACLENICVSCDLEVKTLDQQVYPALDELKSKVSDLTLDRVRSIKGRLLFLTRRVQKMKDEIERHLGNDEHMVEMYLTGKSRLGEHWDRFDGAVDNERRQVIEFERLLDTYLLRFEANLNKLSLLKEQIHDMEAYVNLILDDKQNSRLNLIIMNKTANMVLSIYNGFTAAMAMTIQIPLDNVNGSTSFIWINCAWTAFTISAYVFLLGLFKHKRWLI